VMVYKALHSATNTLAQELASVSLGESSPWGTQTATPHGRFITTIAFN